MATPAAPREPTKVCTECKVDKPLACYAVAQAGKHGRSSKCKMCKKAKYTKSPEENAQSLKERIERLETTLNAVLAFLRDQYPQAAQHSKSP